MTPRVHVGGDQAPPLVRGAPYALTGDAVHHVVQVLRMREGDAITLFTGEGGEWPSTIVSLSRREAIVVPGRHDPVERECAREIVLVQSIIATDTMDFVVRKAVEVGAARIVPILTARSQAVDPDRLARRHAHWSRIAIAACEQCGRNRIPPISLPLGWNDWLVRECAPATSPVLMDAAASRSLADADRDSKTTSIVIGPEGGLTDGEVDAAVLRGARTARLGARVLRAETAALVALARVLVD